MYFSVNDPCVPTDEFYGADLAIWFRSVGIEFHEETRELRIKDVEWEALVSRKTSGPIRYQVYVIDCLPSGWTFAVQCHRDLKGYIRYILDEDLKPVAEWEPKDGTLSVIDQSWWPK